MEDLLLSFESELVSEHLSLDFSLVSTPQAVKVAFTKPTEACYLINDSTLSDNIFNQEEFDFVIHQLPQVDVTLPPSPNSVFEDDDDNLKLEYNAFVSSPEALSITWQEKKVFNQFINVFKL